MSKVKITETYLTNIANTIQAKDQTETQYKPSEMSDPDLLHSVNY